MNSDKNNLKMSEIQIISELKLSGINDIFLTGNPAVTITESIISCGDGKYDFPIHKALKWELPSALPNDKFLGLLFNNEDGSIWHSKLFDRAENGRTGRYIAPKDNGDQPYLPPVPVEVRRKIGERYNCVVPETGSFWDWFLQNKHIPVILTEGGKKVLAAFSQWFVAISLYGCQCGVAKEKYIKQSLAPYLEGRTVYIAFDQDGNKGANDINLTKETVYKSIANLATCLTKIGADVRICEWDKEKGKGLDDVWQFIPEIVNNASKFKVWLRQYTSGKNGYIHERLCDFFKAYFGSKLLFDQDHNEWFNFNGFHWENLTIGSLRVLLSKALKFFQLPLGTGRGLNGIIDTMSIWFSQKVKNQWDDPFLLNFQNGVLDLKSREISKHKPDQKLLFCLPRDYVQLPESFNIFQQLREKCPNFWQWVNFATNGHHQKIFKILCFCNGVLTRRFAQLKKFIFIKGKPDTGKSTFLNLLRNLVGIENSSASNIQSLSKDRGNELADIINKPLVVFPDEDKQYNGHSTLKILTGHADGISFRENYKQKKTQFFKGTIAIASNYHIFLGDTSGLDQRMAFLSLERQVPIEQRDPELDEKLNEELGALTSIALAIPKDLVTEYIQNRGRGYIPELKSVQWESRCEGDSIAAWLNENTIFDENAKVQIGKATYTDTNFAYANYSAWYNENFSNPANKVSVCKFAQKIEEIGHELGMPVWKKKEPTANFICGITLRRAGIDDSIPYYSDLIKFDEEQVDISDSLNIGGYSSEKMETMETSGDLEAKTDEPETLPDKDHGRYGGFGELKIKNFKFNITHRPNSQEIRRHGFSFCNESDWQPTGDYMKHEHEAVQFILKHFPQESQGKWMTVAKLKQIFWPNKTAPVMPTFTKYLDTAFELLEYQGFLTSRNRDNQWLNTEYMIKG